MKNGEHGETPPDISQEEDIQQDVLKSGARRRNPLRAVAFILLAAAAGGVYWFYFSPYGRIRRTMRDMAGAVEKKDPDRFMKDISMNYHDAAGNTRADFETGLRLFFDQVEKITTKIDRMRIEVKGDDGAASLQGTITYTYHKTPFRTKYNESPMVVRLKRENGAWRVVSIDNTGISMKDVLSTFKSIEGEI